MSIITKKVDSLDISCRVCMESSTSYFEFGTPVNFQELDGPTFSEQIMFVTNGLDCFIAPDKNTCYLICSICAEELKVAFRFMEKVRRTEMKMRDLRPPDPSTEDDIKDEPLNIHFQDSSEINDYEVTKEKELNQDENSLLEPFNIEHEEIVDQEQTPLDFSMFIEESNYSTEDEGSPSPPFESLGPQLHCSPCNKTFENQEEMNSHQQASHSTNELEEYAETSGVVNEVVVINPPSDCEEETNDKGE